MKILFCKTTLAGPMSGADEIVVNYALQLRAAGHSPAVLLVHSPPSNDPLVARLRAVRMPLSSLASAKFSTSLAVGRRLAIGSMRVLPPASKLIRTHSRKLVFNLIQRYHDACCQYLTRYQPDLVHVMTPDPGAVMLIRAAHASGIPVVYQEVGIPFHPPGFEEVYERFVTVLPFCSQVATLSPRLAREMSRLVPQIREPQVVPLISHNAANGNHQEPTLPGSTCFGFASRLEHLKGPLRLIEGFLIAHRADNSIELRIAGDGSQRPLITRNLNRLGLDQKCRLVGTYTTLEDRSRFMRDIDVFVLPSLTEGTPNVIIEAMAHGKPIIASAVGGIPDLVSEDIGILVPADDTAALGAAMSRLAGDGALRKTMGEAARKRYEQMFAPQVVLPLLTDFYQRVLESYRGRNNGNQNLPAKSTHPWFQRERPSESCEPTEHNLSA